MIQSISNIDISILMIIREYLSSPLMDKVMKILSTLGNIGFIWIVIGIILLLNKKYRKIGIILLLSLLLGSILGEGIIKKLVQRPRPFLNLENITLIINAPSTYSFPSGHTASSFAAAVVLGKYFEKEKYIFYLLACGIAFSRMYLFVHYPSDVVAGIILGVISAKIIITLVEHYISKKEYLRKES
ncbi:phosphatase PAP2 family protein [Clostridium carnis]